MYEAANTASLQDRLVGRCFKETRPYDSPQGEKRWCYTLITGIDGNDLLTDVFEFSESGKFRELKPKLSVMSLAVGFVEAERGEMQAFASLLANFTETSIIGQCFYLSQQAGYDANYFACVNKVSHLGLHTTAFKRSEPQVYSPTCDLVIAMYNIPDLKIISKDEFKKALTEASIKPITKPQIIKERNNLSVDLELMEQRSNTIRDFRETLKERARKQGRADNIIVSESWRNGVTLTYSKRKGFNLTSIDMLHTWDKPV